MYPAPLYSTRFMEMNKKCPCCHQRFLLEPGFFLGAAYFSYFINAVLLSAAALTLFAMRKEITVIWAIAAIVAIIFGLLPVTLRVSNTFWIHLFVRYEGPCADIEKKD